MNKREDKGEKFIVHFVRESMENSVSWRKFYRFVEGVEDFWVIILPKKFDSIQKTPHNFKCLISMYFVNSV